MCVCWFVALYKMSINLVSEPVNFVVTSTGLCITIQSYSFSLAAVVAYVYG